MLDVVRMTCMLRAALMPALAFTPWQGALAGLALGTVSSGKTLISSRILGISGAIKCEPTLLWRLCGVPPAAHNLRFASGWVTACIALAQYEGVMPPCC